MIKLPPFFLEELKKYYDGSVALYIYYLFFVIYIYIYLSVIQQSQSFFLIQSNKKK